MNTQISLIGAPTDIGAGSRGSSMGPEALRVANIVSVLQSHGLQVIDRGNLSGPANPWLPPVDGYRHLKEVVAWNRAVHDAMYAELSLGRLPILLGGDHCLGVGSISAVARSVIAGVTGNRSVLRMVKLFCTASNSARLRIPCNNSSQVMAEIVRCGN